MDHLGALPETFVYLIRNVWIQIGYLFTSVFNQKNIFILYLHVNSKSYLISNSENLKLMGSNYVSRIMFLIEFCYMKPSFKSYSIEVFH